MKTKTPKHTLVLHINPDLEACFMAHLFLANEDVRDAYGVVDGPALKFIPGGPLRPEDWAGETEITSRALEAKGYVFLDCGGGLFDQHGRPENVMRNSISSLDLMVHVLELETRLPHLMPIAQIITDNDLYGEDVASAHSVKQTSTPHTPRHLRDMILGWNILYKEQPEIVVGLASNAFGCIERCIDKIAEQPEKDVVYKDFFLFTVLESGAVRHFKTRLGCDADDAAINEAYLFGGECERGLVALEHSDEASVWSLGYPRLCLHALCFSEHPVLARAGVTPSLCGKLGLLSLCSASRLLRSLRCLLGGVNLPLQFSRQLWSLELHPEYINSPADFGRVVTSARLW